MKRAVNLMLLTSTLAFGHPMGNFSVSHYARLQPNSGGLDLSYALDLAEFPTFDLLRSWHLERNSPRELLDAKAHQQAELWMSGLRISSSARPLHPRIVRTELDIADGAGNLPIARITVRARLDGATDSVSYEDLNYPERAGWKEIVILAGKDTTLRQASQTGNDISKALSQYPPDPTLAPPQDLRAELSWTIDAPIQRIPKVSPPVEVAAKIVPIPQPQRAPAAASPALRSPTTAPAGAVVRGDFLSKLLHQSRITPWMMVVGLAAAFLLGGAHALTPGHGKTIVAAYLVGSRGTLKHAAFLGAIVTFTHTIAVFVLGLATLFLFRFFVPEKITAWLGVLSGLSIVSVGLWMVYKRWRAAVHGHSHSHSHEHHHHSHDHGHVHPHHHEEHHDHVYAHHGGHDHSHGGHSHVPEDFSWAGLLALGASGGLVPCESALVLLLGGIALGRVGLGLMLLLSFSAGLAAVLIAIGALVLYARNLIPEAKQFSTSWLFRYVPVASSAIVTVVGLLMTGISLGWIRPVWMIG
ncbi:MAG TPA: hypothetical protein VKX49_31750 [Bryobacteraceae bacterium]|nr:hypothetical protein [Bryobacteraceae bacterium]